MSGLQFPCTIFKTKNRMDDYSASDMRYGDLTEAQLKRHYHLVDVSSRVNPYTLTRITPFSQPQSMFCGAHGIGEKLTRQQCAKILFDEFRHLSRFYAVYGPYRHLIEQMITHMQTENGSAFFSSALDAALRRQVLNDKTTNSTLLRIKGALGENIDWDKNCYPAELRNELKETVLGGKLPKFDRFQDSLNGMGVAIHDTWATQIIIKSMNINNSRFTAVVNYKIQDHFGLDDNDIWNAKFNQFRFFRIWFLLQRHCQFAFRPFITNMQTTVEINGYRHDFKK